MESVSSARSAEVHGQELTLFPEIFWEYPVLRSGRLFHSYSIDEEPCCVGQPKSALKDTQQEDESSRSLELVETEGVRT